MPKAVTLPVTGGTAIADVNPATTANTHRVVVNTNCKRTVPASLRAVPVQITVSCRTGGKLGVSNGHLLLVGAVHYLDTVNVSWDVGGRNGVPAGIVPPVVTSVCVVDARIVTIKNLVPVQRRAAGA